MSTIKMGWGTKIALLYLAFAALIITLVVKSMHQSFDLVSKDYYSEELKYQQVINASNNQATLSAAVNIYQQDDNIDIQFPKEFTSSAFKGKAYFYSQANAEWDRTFDLNVIGGHCMIPVNSLKATSYILKLLWAANGKDYYQETSIQIHL